MRQIVSICLLFICVTTSAQELSVKEFREATNDLTARTRSRQDNNGNDCALVKVQLAASGATFTGNVMGNVAFSNNEYWVYLTEGTKRLKVTHPNFQPLDISFADYGINEVSGNCTYVLKILQIKQQSSQTERFQTIMDDTKASIKVKGHMTDADWNELKDFMKYSGKTSVSVDLCEAECDVIPDSAFYNCQNMASITIPNSVTSIGSYAFNYCRGLTSIDIPNSVRYIGESAFSRCSGLTSIIIPNSVTTIGNEAFAWCNNLASITISNSVRTIGKSAFNGCSSLTSITIPNSVTSIGGAVFFDCTGLTSVTIPNSVTSIGRAAFYDCTGLTSITIPNSVTSIGIAAFSGCTGLTSITIPNSVNTIGEKAFECCRNLTSITIPNSVKNIGNDAFYGLKCTIYAPKGFLQRFENSLESFFHRKVKVVER